MDDEEDVELSEANNGRTQNTTWVAFHFPHTARELTPLWPFVQSSRLEMDSY